MLPWTKITHLGDTSLMAPAALLIALWLLLAQRHRLLYCWCALLGLAMLVIAGTKIAFIGWGIGIPALDFTGVSGHTTFAVAVLPVLAFLLLQRYPAPLRASGVLLALGLGALVGISRLVLHFHSVAEVISGYLLGATVSIGFIGLSGALRSAQFNYLLLSASLVVLLAASLTPAAPTQYWLTRVALTMSGHEQPYVRNHSLDCPAPSWKAIRLANFCYPKSGPRRAPQQTSSIRY